MLSVVRGHHPRTPLRPLLGTLGSFQSVHAWSCIHFASGRIPSSRLLTSFSIQAPGFSSPSTQRVQSVACPFFPRGKSAPAEGPNLSLHHFMNTTPLENPDRLQQAKALLDEGANVEELDDSGRRPLEAAHFKHDMELFYLLRDYDPKKA